VDVVHKYRLGGRLVNIEKAELGASWVERLIV
jgi:hypothetical protein